MTRGGLEAQAEAVRRADQVEAQVEAGMESPARARQVLKGEVRSKSSNQKPEEEAMENNVAKKMEERPTLFPDFGPAKGAAIEGAKPEHLGFYAARSRKTLLDASLAHFHKKELSLLTAIAAEQKKQNLIPEPPKVFPPFGPAPGAEIAGAKPEQLAFYEAMARKTLADPAEVRHHLKETALLEAIQAAQKALGVEPKPMVAEGPKLPTRLPQFGPAAGQEIAGAPRKALEFYAAVAKKNLADPSKEKFHAKERALLQAVGTELKSGKDASKADQSEKTGGPVAKLPPFGPAAGQEIAGAPRKALEFYAGVAKKNLGDSAKQRFHASDQALLEAIEGELKSAKRASKSGQGEVKAPERKPEPNAAKAPPTHFRKFGTWAGQPIAGAPREALAFYLAASQKNLADPEKAKFHAAEQALIDVLQAELQSAKRPSKAGKVAEKLEEVTEQTGPTAAKEDRSRISKELMPGQPDSSTKAPRSSAQQAEQRMKAARKGKTPSQRVSEFKTKRAEQRAEATLEK